MERTYLILIFPKHSKNELNAEYDPSVGYWYVEGEIPNHVKKFAIHEYAFCRESELPS